MKSFLLLLLLAACTGQQKDNDPISPSLYQQPKSFEANIKGGYKFNTLTHRSVEPILTPSGEPLITGKPIPALGKLIDPQNFAKPKTVKSVINPTVVKANNNVFVLPENLKIYPVDESALKKFTPPKNRTGAYMVTTAGDTILTGVAIAANGKPATSPFPKETPALPLLMKNNSVYNIQYLDVDQGMSSSNVRSMLEDRSGNLWFGTQDGGVSRYDGKTFVHFTESQGLSNNTVWSMLEDKAGNLWFATWGGGVSMYDGKSFVHFTIAEGLLSNGVFSILEDKGGNIWFGTEGGGVTRFDGKSFVHFTTNEGLPHNTVISMLEDRAGNLWFGTVGGATKYDGNSFVHFTTTEGLSNNIVISIREDKAGNIWFGTYGGGISKYNGKSFLHFTKTDGLSSNVVNSILEDESGDLWFGTSKGVDKFNGKSFVHFTEEEGLSGNGVNSILEDKAGNFWFGTIGGGVNRYVNKSFIHLAGSMGRSNGIINSILEDKAGNLWFGTHGGGVSKYNGNNFVHFTEAQGFQKGIVTSSLEDKFGNLWFGTHGGGVSKYNGKSFVHLTMKEGLSNNSVSSILEDKSGNLWFGTEGGGVSKYNGKSFVHLTTNEGLPHNIVYSMLEDRAGNLWFSTSGGGVSRYDGKYLMNFTEAEGLPSNYVSSIWEDKAGNIWFGTYGGGVSRYDGKSFVHFTTSEGLSNNIVNSILEDKKGNIWFGTHRGVNKYDGKSFLQFTTQEGLPNNNVRSMLEDNSGNLWFATGGGLISYENGPESLKKKPPVVQLRGVSIVDASPDYRNRSDSILQDISYDGVQKFENYPLNLNLPHYKNHLSFHFSAIDWAAPHKIRYSYRMLGVNDNWSIPKTETKADYWNMSPGTFTFQIRAIGENMQWSEPFEYTFTIRPPWWRTWWAYILYGLVFLSALRVFSKWRERKLRDEKEKLQLKVEQRTNELKKKSDDLISSLESLKATQSQLIQSEKMASLGELTAGIAHEIQNPLNFVNNFSEVNTEMIAEGRDAIGRKDWEDAEEILGLLSENNQKILHHGKRADAIVKGMLQHSRGSSGAKEPTNINALADEYLRLAYHGLKAKDKSFNSTIKTNFDESIGNINVVPQDIGRVLLNLINNAFYAVNEKVKAGMPDYTPEVTVTTKLVNDPKNQSISQLANSLIVSVRDNGNGIPPEIQKKIFQPFFTTKPTGQGTGLGLSLCYDIIKAHGGEIRVNSTPGEVSEFMISLPLAAA